MKKAVKWFFTGAAVVIVLAIIGLVLGLVLGRKNKEPEPEEPETKVMYFAMHLADEEPKSRMGLQLPEVKEKCSLKTNVDNVRQSISSMTDLNQLYSFILFTDEVKTTSPMKSDEAISKLNTLRSETQQSAFSQASVMKEFIKRKRGNDRLVYFIPCSFQYRNDDADVKKFVEVMKKAGIRDEVLIVSNTQPVQVVNEVFEVSNGNAAGYDTANIAQKISDFGHGVERTTTSPPPIRTTQKIVPTPAKTTSESPRPPPAPTSDPSSGMRCLFVADLYNYGNDVDAYENELLFLSELAHDFLKGKLQSSVALWVYGFTNYPKSPDLSKTHRNYEDFVTELRNVVYTNIKDPLTTGRAIEVLNKLQDNAKQANCLVFFSAQKNTKLLPMLDPQNANFERIVAVGFNSTDLNEVVGDRGTAVPVPRYYLDGHVQNVLDAIYGRYVPETTEEPETTPKPLPSTTLKPIKTTELPAGKMRCLLVGDMYNFGKEENHYEIEHRFLVLLGYDFFEELPQSSLGLWAYGYTRYSKSPNLDKMNRNYEEFINDMENMEYTHTNDPLTTAGAIQILNKIEDKANRVNCLVFFSSQQNTRALPVLNPKKNFERIVAVGFNDTDLSGVVGHSGTAVRVPYHYLDGHVQNVLDAIMGKYVPETTEEPRTTPRPRPPTPPKPIQTTESPTTEMRCMFVGDMINLGKESEHYDVEADLIAKVGYDFFEEPEGLTAGLWAYGYTKFSRSVDSTLEKMRKNLTEFLNDLRKMNYVYIENPITTERAIEAINEMHDGKNRVNCLVFFTSQVDTTTLPRINPKYVKFDKVVAVGFVGRDVSHIVPENGIPLEIPYNFLDFHVTRIVDAIMGRYKPPPTQRPLTSTVIPTTTSQVPAVKPIKCVFVGDLFNFEDDVDAYYEESELINKVGHDLFDVYPNVAIGFWAYGHTNISKSPNVALENMRKKYDYFMIDLMDMEYIKTDKPTSTAKAIEKLNALRDPQKRANCMVFFSAQQDTTQLPKLNPINMGLERIVAIGFNSTDLNGVVADNGVALSVPYHYLEDDVNLIIDAILGRYKPTTTSDPPTTTTTKKPSNISTPKVPSTTTTTAKKSTTTAKPAPIRHDCLFVGDLYNYGDNVDSYDLEGDLIHKVGHDLFDRSPHSSIGLWAYGYTNFFKSVETSLEKMRGKLDDFVNDLRLMEYFKIQDPLTTVNAIEKLNEAQDPKGRANCLVFFSAKQNTKFLPLLYPNHMNLDRIIAVGLNNTNLDRVVTKQQVALSIPLNHLDEDVQIIVDAIMGTYKPTSTLKPTTAPPKPTTTLKPTTAPPKPSTTSAKPTKPPNTPECLFVGDLYNYGDDVDSYDLEGDLIHKVGHDLFDRSPHSSIGLWAYGYTNFSKSAETSLEKMRGKLDDFVNDLRLMEYFKIQDPLTTVNAIEKLNEVQDPKGRANCLVFFSAKQNTKFLPLLYPNHMNLDRIIAVGLNNTNLDRVVTKQQVALSIPLNHLDEDVQIIVDAIMGTYKPTSTLKPTTAPPKPTTTLKPTTAPPKPSTTSAKPTKPPNTPECLFVGDLYNYGDDVDSYDLEGDLIHKVGHDLFDRSPHSSIGLWAYGYTNFSKSVETSLEKMRGKLDDFVNDLRLMEYFKIQDPLTTVNAIEKLNEVQDPKGRANCLVFFSAKQNTKFLPLLYPNHMNLDRIIAVGLNNTNLDRVVTKQQVVLSIPLNHLDEDVQIIVDAIMGTYKPTSTLKPTTAPPKPTTTLKPTTAPPKPSTTSAKPTPPPNALECLFVGDLYNYGENVDEYEREARFISTVVHDFFEEPLGYSAGLWAYGFSKFPKSPDLNRMSFNYDEIKTYLDDIKYTAIVDPLKTSSAVDAINKLKDNGSRANCLVFFSAEMNSTALPKLNPQNKKFKRIVAVGLNDTDLSSVITSDGISVSVPLHPRSEDVKSVIDAIMGRYKPTSKPTTTVLPTTTVIPTTKTVAPSRSPDCLFVGDLYNFEDDENAYEHEAEFIAEVTEKFFDESGSSSAGIWAYGHTDFLKTVNSSLENMSRHHHEFLLQLEKMSYAKTDDPLTTSQAIGAINEMYDTENRINCLVFFSAQEDTRGLPRIEPQHMRLDKVVAVGYNDRNLNDIIPNYGVAISVSKEYEEKDVEHVVRAILRR